MILVKKKKTAERSRNIKGEPIEQVQSYCFLGSKITEDGKSLLGVIGIINRVPQKKSISKQKPSILFLN